MTKQKNLKQLIDEVMEEFDEIFSPVEREGQVYYHFHPEIGDELKDFLHQFLIKIAKATAEAGKLREYDNTIEIPVDPEQKSGENRIAIESQLRSRYRGGFNQAVQEQQQKLKEFMGEYYDQKAKEND